MSKDLTPTFLDILKSDYVSKNTFKILIYTGDADTPNNMMISQLFVENLVNISNDTEVRKS